MANEIRTEELVKLDELVKWHLVYAQESKDEADDFPPNSNGRASCLREANMHRATARLLTAQAASLGECVAVMDAFNTCGRCGHYCNAHGTATSAALTRARAVQAGGDPYAKVVEVAKRILAKLQHPTAHVTIIDSEDLEAALAEVTNGR